MANMSRSQKSGHKSRSQSQQTSETELETKELFNAQVAAQNTSATTSIKGDLPSVKSFQDPQGNSGNQPTLWRPHTDVHHQAPRPMQDTGHTKLNTKDPNSDRIDIYDTDMEHLAAN